MPKTKTRLAPVILPLYECPSCGFFHPKPKGSVTGSDSPWLSSQQAAGFLGIAVSTLFSAKSRNALPGTLRGRKSPTWDPCRLAIFLNTGKKD